VNDELGVWRSRSKLTLMQAAYLSCGLDPSTEPEKTVIFQILYQGLCEANQAGIFDNDEDKPSEQGADHHINVSAIKNWLYRKNIIPEFFFPVEKKDTLKRRLIQAGSVLEKIAYPYANVVINFPPDEIQVRGGITNQRVPLQKKREAVFESWLAEQDIMPKEANLNKAEVWIILSKRNPELFSATAKDDLVSKFYRLQKLYKWD